MVSILNTHQPKDEIRKCSLVVPLIQCSDNRLQALQYADHMGLVRLCLDMSWPAYTLVLACLAVTKIINDQEATYLDLAFASLCTVVRCDAYCYKCSVTKRE